MATPNVAPGAGSNPAAKTVTVAPAVDPGVGLVTVNVFDGTRRLVRQGMQILLTVHDGLQNQLYRDYVGGPSIPLKLPFHNNAIADDYSIVAWSSDYEQAGFQPVTVKPASSQFLDVMLLPKNSDYHFAQAQWADLLAKKPKVAEVFTASLTGDAGGAYSDLMDTHPDHLACLLNITAAMEQINLVHYTPIHYFKQFDLDALAPDRIFGYADAQLVEEVRAAAHQGEFDVQAAIDLALHGDATSSFKQNQFGQANVQLTFHEKDRRTIGGVDCVRVEPDIDYYKDPGGHFLLEVIPNKVTGGVSSPRVVYVLRWMAGQQAGIANFDPLYTIE